jgi:putative ABC transport system substrate-binding protein
MQLAKEVVPHLKRAGLLFEATNPEFQKWADQFRANAETFGVSVRPYGVRDLDEIRSAFAHFDKERVQALFLWATPLMLVHRASILEFATHKFPVITQSRELAEAGALVSYSADFVEMWRHGAVYVDKILKGANPGDLPIERPTKIDVRINQRTAKDLGITIPKSILLQADQIIE